MTTIRPYVRARCNELNLREWKDGFAFDNIPRNLINRSYHIESNLVDGIKLNQNEQELSHIVNLRVFLKGYRDPASGIDDVILLSENVIKQMLDTSVRVAQTGGIKNVYFDGMVIEPIDEENDNFIISNMTFRFLSVLSVE